MIRLERQGAIVDTIDGTVSKFLWSSKMLPTGYTAVVRQDGPWWIGWIEEVSGVNSQGSTRDELLSNLREALVEAIEMNREEARNAAAGESYEEVAIQL